MTTQGTAANALRAYDSAASEFFAAEQAYAAAVRALRHASERRSKARLSLDAAKFAAQRASRHEEAPCA